MPAIQAEPVNLQIERMGAQGDGVARGPDGRAVYVPLTLPGEWASVRVDGDRGEVVALIESSPDRIAPASPHYGDCGGCSLQHWSARPYLYWKRDQVRQALEREGLQTAIKEVIACGPGLRRRLALHARPGKAGEARLGFKARRSWRLVEVTACPVALPSIQARFPDLARLAAAFLENPRSAPTLHVTSTLTGMDIEVTGVERRQGALSADARVRAAAVAAAADFARVTLGGEMLYQSRSPMVRMGSVPVELPPGGFLQAVESAQEAMASLCCEALAGAGRIADLFCGIGAFTFPLAKSVAVRAIDSSAPAITALAAAADRAQGLKPVQAEVRDLFRQPLAAEEMRKLDAAVIDPPRAGALAQSREIARSKLQKLVYVSCSPSTFARDAKVLSEAGFRLVEVTPVDQFLWSPHIELVGVFER